MIRTTWSRLLHRRRAPCSFGTPANTASCSIMAMQSKRTTKYPTIHLTGAMNRPYLTAKNYTKHSEMYVRPGEIPYSDRLTKRTKRKFRIRLHGSRLPPGYTLSVRLHTSNNRHEQPKKPVRKRRRKASETGNRRGQKSPNTSDTESEKLPDAVLVPTTVDASKTAYERELEEQEDEKVRLTNAYPGATNSINSIHQRKWYLSMDRLASGFTCRTKNDGTKEWVRRGEGDTLWGFEPFFVRGRDYETSVVTGRTADEVMRDEGVEGFTGRKGWRAVME